MADGARADAANSEAAHLRLTQEEAVGQADLVARRRRAPTERIDITALGRNIEDEAAAEVEMLRALKARADIFDAAAEPGEILTQGQRLPARRTHAVVAVVMGERINAPQDRSIAGGVDTIAIFSERVER